MDSVRSADGTQLAFDRVGEGPPVVVVGGALSTRMAAAPLAALLAPRFTVLTFDRRGRGDSGDTPPFAVDREVEDLDAMIGVGGAPALVFGHSSGGGLAIEGAARGLDIAKLAVYEPPFIVDDSRPPLPGDYFDHLDELVADGRRGDAVAYFLTAGVGLPSPVVDQMRAAPMWPDLEALAHTISYDGRIMVDHMAGEALPAAWATSVTMPTLVMAGGNSPDWIRISARALAELLPAARHVTVEGQDHGPPPEVIEPLLVEFFTD